MVDVLYHIIAFIIGFAALGTLAGLFFLFMEILRGPQ